MPSNPLRICQVTNPTGFLPCGKTVGEFRCEEFADHETHRVGTHTLRHAAAGGDFTCDEIDDALQAFQEEVGSASAPIAHPQTTDTPATEPKRLNMKIVLPLAFIIPIIGAFIWVQTLGGSSVEATGVKSDSGSITAVNHDLVPYSGKAVEGTNVEQKALSVKTTATDPAAFIFSNGKESSDRKVVDLYIDFSHQRSRDLVLLNKDYLKNQVENGTITLKIHAVPSSSPYSIYGPEVVAEGIYLDPDHGWDLLVDVLKYGRVVTDEQKSQAETLKGLVAVSRDLGYDEIDRQSITNGTFVAWILSVAEDPQLKLGEKIPLMRIGGKTVAMTGTDLPTTSNYLELVGEKSE